MSLRRIWLGLALFALVGAVVAEEPIDWDAVNLIRDEGFERSQVMETLRVASFVYPAAMRDERFPRKPMPQKPPKEPKKAGDEDHAD